MSIGAGIVIAAAWYYALVASRADQYNQSVRSTAPTRTAWILTGIAVSLEILSHVL